MKIALVSKTNGCVGGASFFAENLGGWLLEAGQEVTHFCLEPKGKLLAHQRPVDFQNLPGRILRHLNWRTRRAGLIETLPFEYWFGLKAELQEFDLVHFHDLYQAVSHRTLEMVARQKPVFLTVHDASSYTGGCLYPLDCRRFVENCGRCPQRAEIGSMDFTRHNLKRVRRLARRPGVNYVFPSEWIQKEAQLSLHLARTASHHIPNGFDPRPYRFKSRQSAREKLGIQADQKVVAFSSASLEQKRKGARFALAALRSIKDLAPLALVIGHASEQIQTSLNGIDSRLAGFVTEREQLGLLYAAADVVIYPSLADNLPITIQEAMAAGTPVLAFEVGGVPELVRQNETGWLVPTGDQEAFNFRLRTILKSADAVEAGLRGQKFVADEFTPAQCVNRHLDLYRTALNSPRREFN